MTKKLSSIIEDIQKAPLLKFKKKRTGLWIYAGDEFKLLLTNLPGTGKSGRKYTRNVKMEKIHTSSLPIPNKRRYKKFINTEMTAVFPDYGPSGKLIYLGVAAFRGKLLEKGIECPIKYIEFLELKQGTVILHGRIISQIAYEITDPNPPNPYPQAMVIKDLHGYVEDWYFNQERVMHHYITGILIQKVG